MEDEVDLTSFGENALALFVYKSPILTKCLSRSTYKSTKIECKNATSGLLEGAHLGGVLTGYLYWLTVALTGALESGCRHGISGNSHDSVCLAFSRMVSMRGYYGW